MPSRRACSAPFSAVKISGSRSSSTGSPFSLQQLERDRVVGAARHGDAAQRGGPAQHLAERVHERVPAVAGGVHQGAVDVPEDQSHRPCIHARLRAGTEWVYRALKGGRTRPPIGAVTASLRAPTPHGSERRETPGPVSRRRAARGRPGGRRGGRRRRLPAERGPPAQRARGQRHVLAAACCATAGCSTAAPSGIPAAFMDAIDGSAIGPHVGTCGAAAFRARPMVTPDIREDPKWEPFRAPAAAAGLRSCWSVPLRLPGRAGAGHLRGLRRPSRRSRPRPAGAGRGVRLAGGARPGPASGARRGCPRATRRWWWRCRRRWTSATSTRASTPPRPRGWPLEVGRRMGLDKAGLQRLEQAAMLHDIGKLGIPTEILHAPRALTDEERTVMEQHPVIGERILKGMPYLEEVARAVRHEHERWDGTGYPDGLAGEAIPLASRDRVRLRRLARHDLGPALPQGAARATWPARSWRPTPAPSSTRARWRPCWQVVGERRGEPAPPIGGQVDAESEENHRIQQLASVAEQTGAEDLFVFRLTSRGALLARGRHRPRRRLGRQRGAGRRARAGVRPRGDAAASPSASATTTRGACSAPTTPGPRRWCPHGAGRRGGPGLRGRPAGAACAPRT